MARTTLFFFFLFFVLVIGQAAYSCSFMLVYAQSLGALLGASFVVHVQKRISVLPQLSRRKRIMNMPFYNHTQSATCHISVFIANSTFIAHQLPQHTSVSCNKSETTSDLPHMNLIIFPVSYTSKSVVV